MFGPTSRLLKVWTLVAVALAFYAIARLEFCLWNWGLFRSKEISDILWAFVVGMRFDIAAALTLTSPVLLWSFLPWPDKWKKFWQWTSFFGFVLVHIPFYIVNLVDTEFINFVGRRFSYDGFFIVGELQGKLFNFLMAYKWLFAANTVLVGLFIWAAWKVIFFPPRLRAIAPSLKMWSAHGFLCFVSIIVAIIGIRGGLQSKPVNFVNANVFAAPLLNNLVLNSSFTLIKSYGAEEIKREKYFTDEKEMISYLNGSFKGSLLEGKRPKNPQNVVIIILESFGKEYFGIRNGKSYTPFLDSLMAQSLVFENGYANGRRSIEGVAAVLGSIPALMSEPFISSHFTSNYFLGLGTLLGEKKYSTSFFHGGHNGTMYFDSFMQSAGVEKYFGSSEYNNAEDDDGVWGIWDEPFLQWMLTQLDSQKPPFMTSVFTLSSHQPFKVPEKYKEQFPEGEVDILKTIAYTDFALKKFFETAATKPWFKDTLFVITADHTSKHYLPEYDNEIGNYRIPMMFYHPTWKMPAVDTQMVVQQIDIMPTILDMLSIAPKDQNYMGSSVFVPGDKTAVNFIDGRYLLTAKDYQVRWAPGHGEPEMYAINDLNAVTPLAEPAKRKEDLIKRMKATIQYFNEGMWDNKIYYPSGGR
jgi:phosphoglycerol transferase MdoB-like AlkP superfamily enzyme